LEIGEYLTVNSGELPTMEHVRLKHRWFDADTPNAHPKYPPGQSTKFESGGMMSGADPFTSKISATLSFMSWACKRVHRRHKLPDFASVKRVCVSEFETGLT
jgi:hypothetical protein